MTPVADTPSSFWPVASGEALTELEFDRALELVARFAVSVPGAESVLARRPSSSTGEIRLELEAVAQLARVLRDAGGFDPEPVPALGEILRALRTEGSVLEGSALATLHVALVAMRRVAASLRSLEDDAPRVAALAVEPPPRSLEQGIGRAIEPDGSVKDDASPELRRARRRLRETRTRLIAQLEQLLRKLSPHDALPDAEVTVRGGRYVIPVRRESRGRVRGIVHGESSSGATLFIEPADVVELGNALSACEAEEARAIHAVLRTLSERARPLVDEIEAGWEMCVRVDDLYSRARYAVEVEAYQPTVATSPARLVINRGVHPLLLADSDTPVPFDLVLDPGERTLVVSGPNAGGKTVLLKAVGLISALAQAGVIPPVGPGTTLPVFARIFSDIGDHQSISASLSSFSAHVAALRSVLLDADASSLVLLDEVGGGTDPVEGAALAGAVLLALNGRGSTTMATTHLNPLKELAAGTEGIVNASLEFDAESLSPTYRLLLGKPGRSYGLAIARRLALPDEVLATAEQRVPAEARSVDAILAELEAREAKLAEREDDVARERARLERESQAAQQARAELDERLAAVERREREQERLGRERARRFLLEARRRVEQALGLARAAVNEATAKEARRLVEEGVSREAEALEQLEGAAKAKGWRVTGGSGKGEGGRVIEMGTGKGEGGRVDRSPDLPVPPSPEAEVDVRGMRADEAEAALIRALDNAVMADLPALRIIHGKGTGALRARVSQVLKRDPRVGGFQLAPPEQGGTGVTLVELKR